MDITQLRLTEITLIKAGVSYHKIFSNTDPICVYIQPFKMLDSEGHIYVHKYGLVELTSPDQLHNFMEFKNGELISF